MPTITQNTLFTEQWNGEVVRAAYESDAAHLEAGGAIRNLLRSCFVCALDFVIAPLDGWVDWVERDTEDGYFYVDADCLWATEADSPALLQSIVKLANEYLYEKEPASVTEGYSLDQFKAALGYAN